jgi:hypothetical protein
LVRKPEISIRKSEVSVQNLKVSDKIFELKTSVKVVFRNASVAETQNFELLSTSETQYSYQKWNQICFMMEFEEQNG